MNLAILTAYGICNIAMIAYYVFSGKNRYFEFPFWAGVIGLGWFFPQAVGGYHDLQSLPEGYFFKGLLFATLCTVALWLGYVKASRKQSAHEKNRWLMEQYDPKRLYYSCVLLILFGFFFHYKLMTLPKELVNVDLWTGKPVMYLFFSNMFKIGFVGLFIIYLRQRKLLVRRFFLLIPCIVLMLLPVLFGGRRGEMMRFTSAMLFPLWFVRRWAIPRIWIIIGLVSGIILINAIGLYRSAMAQSKDLPFDDRLRQAFQQNYLEANKDRFEKTGAEFQKYIYRMAAIEKLKVYDFGLSHWNEFVFTYVPAQLVGRSFKKSLMIEHVNPVEAGKKVFNFSGTPGATHTGYMDAFASFSYAGLLKYWIIGWIMGVLYRIAMEGFFLPQVLYALAINAGMHGITHTTNEILIRIWVYFFIFGFFPFYYSRADSSTHNEMAV